MKKIQITLLVALTAFSFCFSQETNNLNESGRSSIEDRKNEFKVGVIKLLAIPTLDVEYERILNRYTSLGGNVTANFNNNSLGNRFSFSPYFRMYFTESKEYGNKGFFGQAFVSYINGDEEKFEARNALADIRAFNSLNLGFGVGKKWVNQQGFVFQIVLGGARAVVKDDLAPEFVFQGDLFIGYRF